MEQQRVHTIVMFLLTGALIGTNVSCKKATRARAEDTYKYSWNNPYTIHFSEWAKINVNSKWW